MPKLTLLTNPRLQLPTPVYGLPMTLVLSVLLLIVFLASQLIGVALFASWVFPNMADFTITDKIQQGSHNGTLMAWAVVFTLVTVASFIALMIRAKQASIGEYLAIKGFRWRQFLGFVGLLLLLNVAINGITVWLEREPMAFMDELAKTANPLWLLVLAMVVFAPIYEELMFRGFMWTGLASSKLGVWGASILTSLVFAMIHGQYGAVELGAIVVLAMLFSSARIVSGSLLLPIVLHIINNGLAMWQYLAG
ncbi:MULTISPECIES: CPBP family intramembrane glutamic endopeptidase [unclassified Moraxella]|uniref:CPBP family intramembrane glutamic endopeptidase n=1 Tax=unclassified Moraxella TaxID=2685852 RepID=UPI003AF5C4B6